MKRPARILTSLVSSLVLVPALFAGAPPTAVEPVVDEVHGVRITDPYRWLEGSDAPELGKPTPELDAKVGAWTDAQNAYTRSVLDGLPGREVFAERLAELDSAGTVGAPRVRGDLYFNRERRGDQDQAVLYVRRGQDGAPRALLDPNQLDSSGLTTLAWFEPGPKGRLVAFGLYQGGDESSTLYVLETESGRWLAEEIPGKVRGVSWLPDGSGFVYHRLADVSNPYSTQIKLHRLGFHHRQDPLIFEQYKEGPLATTWGPRAFLSDDGRWLGLSYATGTDSNDLWVYDFAHWQETGELVRTDVVLGEDAASEGAFVGDKLYLHTTLGAPNGRVVEVDLENPGRDAWREVVGERSGAVLEGVEQAAGFLVLHYLEDATSKIELVDLADGATRRLELPGLGSARLVTEPSRREAFLSYQSWSEPTSIYRVDLGTGERQLWARPDVPVDPDLFTVEQAFATSKDGTRLPIFVVHKKGLVKDGTNPTILNGYGGFNISQRPHFNTRMIPWLEAGGVYAVAGLRGGGEYGEDWHRAGMLEHKQNVFDDFIAAAEWLIESGTTKSEHLGIAGGSNGGLLTGAALTQRPDLFSAVFVGVPLLDMLRYQNFLMARYWVPEYGTAEDPEQFPFLRAYSPYHQVKEGTKYPAVLLTAGENDARVHPLHARKMAAKLQAATANDNEREPILLWVERDAGHGAGKPLDLRHREDVDRLSFMAWQLGLEVRPEVKGAGGPVGK